MEIPEKVKFITSELEKNGFAAEIVGGCVRDLLRQVEPGDWDIATNAKPEEVENIMEKAGLKTFYENEFWTVGVVLPQKSLNGKFKKISPREVVEITTYRSEIRYSDKRHPDEIKPARTIEEDLSRRDLTVNAMALRQKSAGRNLKFKTSSGSKNLNSKFVLIDPFGGRKDLKDKIIRAVGNPKDRFSEDALRMMRAVRFSVTLGPDWKIEKKTSEAIKANANGLAVISKERIRDEFLKIIMSFNAAEGIELLRENGLLRYIVPELEEGYKVSQNKHHIYDCYEHGILSLKYASQNDFNVYVRLAALFHDIAKPRTKKGDGPDATFYGHEILGAEMTGQILDRLRFPKKDSQKIIRLVRYHLFYYNAGEVSESSVRRLVRQVGPENMEELLEVRMADRIGSGVPKAEPYKLRHLRYLIEKVSQDPLSFKMLAVNGNEVMAILGLSPGPKVGHILEVLFGEILTEPKKNDKEFLKKEIKRLGDLSGQELAGLAQKAKKEREELQMKRDEMTKAKYWVT